MIHYSGYYFCTRSNWDGQNYSARNLVSIEKYDEEYGDEDFKNLIAKKKIFDEESFKYWEDKYNGDSAKLELHKQLSYKECFFLKPEVVKWLNETVFDDKKTGEKGWCVGNDEYNSGGGMSFSLWFYRRKDALKFIKEWSVYKKPTETYNQDSYIKKTLDLKTNKLTVDKV